MDENGLTPFQREDLDYVAHLKVFQPAALLELTFYSDEERRYFDAAVMRLRLQHARRSSEIRCVYGPAVVEARERDLGDREPTAPSAPTPRSRPRGAGRPKLRGASARSSARSGDGGDEGPSDEPPPAGRLCENTRCERDISRRHPLARYCDDACQQQALRDRRTLELLDEIVGTIAEGLSCVCDPQRNTLEPGYCHHCGYPRGVVTREWVKEPGPRARVFVATKSLPPHELRVRPDRELSARLRTTRRDWKVAA